MFRPGNLGHLGRLGLVAASQPSLIAQALAILAKYGSAANLYLPGVGAISGITAGNWLDSVGTTAATVDGQVGLVVSAGKELGPELRGNFVIDKVGTAPNATYNTTTGAASVTRVDFSNQSFIKITGLNEAGTYAVVLSSDSSNTNTIGIRRSGSGGTIIASVAAGATSTIYITGDSSFFITSSGGNQLLNVSTFRLAPGAHLTQSTAANRPVLRQSGGVYAWQFDGSNDSFTSTLTPGNAGFFCASARFTDSGSMRTLVGAGAGEPGISGVWFYRSPANNLTLLGGDGTGRTAYAVACPSDTSLVASCGWDASVAFVGVNNTETSSGKIRNFTSSNTASIGVLTGTTNPMLGTIGATIIMPTVLPTATERATLRQFIASLSGVTM